MDLDFDVVGLGEADHPAEGEKAPEFTRPLVNDEFWEDVALSELCAESEGPVVLVFHAMDGAFPATYVWNEIRDRGWHEQATVVGLSISTPYAHKDLLEERDIEGDHRLYSDPANGVAEQYGIAMDLDGMTGLAEPRPAVFVLDSDRTIEYAWVGEEWPSFPDYDAVEAQL
ncbi:MULTISPECIES: redoxin domain-containing protein [Haloarcula]|uniref:Peroxiredoxin n=1 Tax=Haloarcula pellucida TaxID=1427151 RepID=A0A830GSR8_9EURY|nr:MULTISPECIES: redoxin domain-containing protein [Halomicroarcula]MBX0349351.1 redoxin domain-containing protein [Halomicroarcula pellucida]MDS0279063.1 redoxin domain-containing protein [Halomicroarcula sp. S1AR25-4]GGO03352.1 peroxiredoxin [Halomicroarcula pellucida]